MPTDRKGIASMSHSDSIAEMRLLLNTETQDYGSPVLTFSVAPVRLTADGELRNITDSSFDHEPLTDLVISGQLDYVADDVYGYRVEYRNVYSVDCKRAEMMAKQLRKIQRGLDKIEADLGYPESFAAFVARVGSVLGAKAYGWRAHRRGGMYADNVYRWTDASGFASHVATLARDFKRDHVAA